MAIEMEEEVREGQFQEHRYLVPTHPPATVQGYREEAASLQIQREAPTRPHIPLTLPFRCQSTASSRFNILTLRAAEN